MLKSWRERSGTRNNALFRFNDNVRRVGNVSKCGPDVVVHTSFKGAWT